MYEVTPEIFEAAKQSVTHGKINYLNVAGIIPELAEVRHVRYRLPLTSMHVNHVGIMYAGSFFVFAESTGAGLIKCTYGNAYVPIIKSVSIDYLKPATSDLVIDISMTEEEAKERIAYVEEHGKGQYPMTIPIMTADGVHTANVNIVFYLMKNNK
jgi:acyl-coenzyme A thioesterase PaaI-like protein